MSLLKLTSFLLVYLLTSLTLAGEPSLIDDPQGWKLESDGDGIKLYSRTMSSQSIIPLKGEMIVPGSLEQTIAVLDDKSRRKEWVERYVESRLLEKPNHYSFVEYVRMDFPLWFNDRVTVAQINIEVSENLKKILIRGHSIDHPKIQDGDNATRATIYDSSIKLEDMGGQVKISMIIYANPNGAIPSWVVNLFTETVARNSMRNLRAQISKNLYKKEILEEYRIRMRDY